MSLLIVRARRRLFNVGWRPHMMEPPYSPKIHAALLDLNEANRRTTQAAIRNARHS